MNQHLLSPPSEPASSPDSIPIPLDSPTRTTPIHELLPDIRLPHELPTYRYHPVTCASIEPEDVRAQVEQLRKQFPTPEAALRAQEQVARELKQKLEDAERKREEVQKTMDKKIKERNMELKVLSKYQDGKSSALPT
ncbi:uncharacterized protein BJX67DRAFT_377733 [Aspergillus lucknowensis]|uniref:Mediator of RNA polymerase II transcription subunit 9 n=1 Tax=Aspergillus lucknowensis TaxID=176173 RepID=A0ABR4M3G5_9EURO